MTLIYFILILGITIFIHELGHFIFAKKAGIYVYEFSVGMGPKIYSFKRKNDETTYSIRLIPLGGYVQMAGEEVEDDELIPYDKKIQSKSWGQRFITIVAGALFNFLLAIVFLFIIGLFFGSPETSPIVGEVSKEYPAYTAGVEEGDLILSIDGKKMDTWDDVLLELELIESGKTVVFKFEKSSGQIKTLNITPIKEVNNGEINYKYGISMTEVKNFGLFSAIEFTFVKFVSVIKSMAIVVSSLITGGIGIESLAGPVGIYNIIGQEARAGIVNILYLVAFLSINVGFINLLPFPAFDGGRVLFLIIEKIKGSRVNAKVENIIHAVGFVLLILFMILITMQDIKKLF